MSNGKILIIEDTVLIAKAAQKYLEGANYEVQHALDGASGIKAAKEWLPDVILLDVSMLGMDGFEVCRRLRAMTVTATTPIILCTALSSIADKTAGFEAGADDYLVKPFQATELLLRVAAQLRRSKRTPAALEAPKQMIGRVISHFSLRGGSGCTSLAVNSAIALNKLWGASVVLVDLVRPVGVCDAMLNLHPKNRLDTLLNKPPDEIDADLVMSCLTDSESGIKLLGGLENPVLAEQVTENLVTAIIEHLRQRYHYVVLDLSHDLSAPTVAALDHSDQIVMPFPPDINAVRLTNSALEVFKALGYASDPYLIVNWVFPKNGVARAQIEKTLKRNVQTVIPYVEGTWCSAINNGTPLINGDADSPLVTLLEDLAWRLSDPRERESKPEKPTAMWQRVTHRLSAQK